MCPFYLRPDRWDDLGRLEREVIRRVVPLLLRITLFTVAVSPSAAWGGPFAYVGHATSDGQVYVIDTATNTIAARVTAGHNPVAVAVHPTLPRAYVANAGDATVSVLDTDTNAIVTAVPVGMTPISIAVAPNGQSVYVGNALSNSVSVINVATNIETTRVRVGASPRGIAVTPDSQFVYVATSGAAVAVISAATTGVLTAIPVGDDPSGIAATPDGRFIYVANQNSGTVSVITVATNEVSTTVTLGGAPRGIAVSPDGVFAYVTDMANGQVFKIVTATNTVQTAVAVAPLPAGLAVTAGGDFLYVAHLASVAAQNRVSVIATATNSVSTTVTVGLDPIAVAVGPTISAPIFIACPANQSALAPFLCLLGTFCGATVSFPPPLVSADAITSCSPPPSGEAFPLGQTTITCSARAPDGTQDTCSFDVTVAQASLSPGILTPIATADLSLSSHLTLQNFVIVNGGPDTATGVQIGFDLPEAVSVESIQTSQGTCTVSDRRVTCAMGDLPSGARANAAVNVNIPGSSTFLAQVSVSSGTFDPNPFNNFAFISIAGFSSVMLHVPLPPPPAECKAPSKYALAFFGCKGANFNPIYAGLAGAVASTTAGSGVALTVLDVFFGVFTAVEPFVGF